jgi:2',3'-cyclic-nucleotide 2'-phosphodiesterase (5'-nucleotidase family)
MTLLSLPLPPTVRAFFLCDLTFALTQSAAIPFISSPGAGTTFQDPITVVQATIDHIHEKYNPSTKIIAMTHIGYDQDQLLAAKTRGVYLVIGGHSHTLLGDMPGAEGKYPTVIKNLEGEDVFVVTAFRWGEYLGYLDVAYDPSGKIVAYTGGPIHLTNATEFEPKLQAEIKEWRKPFEVYAAEVVGSSAVVLDQTACKGGECVLGDVMTDAIMDYRHETADFAHINGGGVRASIDVGEITRGEVITAFPFGNAVVELKISGSDIWKIYEGIFSQHSLFNPLPVIPTGQVSKEIRIKWNPAAANGTRLVSIDIAGKPIDLTKTYTVATVDFIAGGGDNQFPKVPPTEYATLDTLDEVLVRYIKKSSPVNAAIDGRISTTNGTSSTSTIASSTTSSTIASSTVASSTGASTTVSSTGSSSSPSSTPAPPKCPLDLNGDKGTRITLKSTLFTCAYPTGSCTWWLPKGNLRNEAQPNCPKQVVV